MNYQDSIKLLTSQEKFHINLGLDRMQKLAKLFNNPQNDFKIIHVAGTNGKGSTCAMLAKILEKNGYKTGLYTSPHIKDYTERIKINFSDISQNDFAKYIELVEDVATKNNIELTEFEILTMVAFLYFQKENVQFAVMETGMGGRLDATNIVTNPILTIITSISLDHLDRLGNNIDEIAFEKSGILKENIPIVISKSNLGIKVVTECANKKNSPILLVEKNFNLINTQENIFSNGNKEYKLSLRGINQGKNLALVDKACEYLKLDVNAGLSEVTWESRFQYFEDKKLIVDAAHNPDAIILLNRNLDTYFPNKKRAFLFGVLNTKDYKTIIKNLFRDNDEIFITDNFAHNAINKNILAEEIMKQQKQVQITLIDVKNIDKFINYTFDGIKICCGSFYICSKIYN